MVEKIVLLSPPRSQYGVLRHFTKNLYDALCRLGIDCRILGEDEVDRQQLHKEILRDCPDCTVSFNGLLPDEEGRFFCDMLQLPHVACLVDSPNQFLSLTQSSYSIIACVDRFFCDFFRGFNFENVLFFPHAVDGAIAQQDIERKKEHDVVMPVSFIDYEGVRTSWGRKHPPALCQVLDEAVEGTLSDQSTSHLEAFTEALYRRMTTEGDLDPHVLDFGEVLDDLELYIKGKNHVELVKAVGEFDVHIFGTDGDASGWGKYLKGHYPNVVIHEALPYEKVIDVVRKSKVILNSSPLFKSGGHERIFLGLACSSLVVTAENSFIVENFEWGNGIVYYYYKRWDEVREELREYLSNDSKREEAVLRGRERVLKEHT